MCESCESSRTDVLSPLELIDVDVYDLRGGQSLLQRQIVRVVFRCGLPQFCEQQRVLHDPLDRFDDQGAHVQQIRLSSVEQQGSIL